MKSNSTVALLLLLAVLACFVWYTSQTLPTVVASHFAANGEPNGFMSRGAYMTIMLLVIVGPSGFVAFLPAMLINKNNDQINLPNREYWLTPERRAEAIAALCAYGRLFGAIVALFLAYAHWMVVQANFQQPPTLSMIAILHGLIAFTIATILWLIALYRRFRIPA